MRCIIIKSILFVLLTTAAVVLTVVSLVAWGLRGYLNDDWDWL